MKPGTRYFIMLPTCEKKLESDRIKYCRARQPTAFPLPVKAIELTHPTGLVSGLNAKQLMTMNPTKLFISPRGHQSQMLGHFSSRLNW